LVVALATSVAAPALACKDGKHEKASFPMAAATFQEKIDRKAAKIRARTEERLQESGATAEQAKQERARVEAILASIQAVAKKAMEDGVVTVEEAQAVRAAGRELRKHKKDRASRA
jgi:hypothetical protein